MSSVKFFKQVHSGITRTWVIPLIFILFLVSCTTKTKVVEETFPDGSPRRECEYIGKEKNKVLLKETFYYQNGQVELTGKYKDGERDGYWTYYYENGNVWSEGFYKMGKNDGKRLTYFENGRIRYEAYYSENERVGVWKFYDQAGNVIKEVDYSKSPNEEVETPDS